MKNIYEVIVPVVIIIACLALGFLNNHTVKLVKPSAGHVIAVQITPTGDVKVVPTPVIKAPVPVVPVSVAVVPAPVKPVIATPAVVVTPLIVHTLTPAQAVSVVHAVVPYMNHGNFYHGNSNPSWPVK